MKFNRVRAFAVVPRGMPRPHGPHFWDWDINKKRFGEISSGWHSEPKGYDPEKHDVFYSDLKFKNGKPDGVFSKPRLLTSDVSR